MLGLDPKVDVDSIRIEGSGTATITDIQTDIVRRRITFEDVYGETDSSSDESDQNVPAALGSLRLEYTQAEERLEKARANEATAKQVLHFLDAYGRDIDPGRVSNTNLHEFIEQYIERRETETARSCKAKVDMAREDQTVLQLTRKISKFETQIQKEREKTKRQSVQKKAPALRKRREQRRFWTTREGQVTMLLDSHSQASSGTPGSSRRSSLSLTERTPSDIDIDEREVTLRLSYVVPGPKWTSRYELSINTPSPTPTGQLTYNAEFENQTSETWKHTRVTLSTSPTSLVSGLGKDIPSLQAWHLRLTMAQDDSNEQPAWEKIILSASEMPRQAPTTALSDYEMQFMLWEQQNKRRLSTARRELQDFEQDMEPGQPRQPEQPTVAVARALDQLRVREKQEARISEQQAQSQQAQRRQQMPQTMRLPPAAAALAAAPPPIAQRRMREMPTFTPDTLTSNNDDIIENFGLSSPSSPPSLEYEDSTRQEYGMTTKYDLPGRRTLTPSRVNRRHALAKLDFKTMTLQHVIVPKHRPVAFLRAHIRNTSSIQLLRGSVGLKVDGTFLGTSTIPTCAPNDTLELSLGVDPSIMVTYAKPTVRRQTSGLFVKENVAVFRRSVWVKNTKGVRANIVILDQVPVSHDEKLQQAILEPRGLAKENDSVSVDTDGKGECKATMGKDGEVRWMLDLDAGKSIRLVLQYEMKAPTGHHVSVS